MRHAPLLLILSGACALNTVAQSGRRISTSRAATPAAPIQAPLTPEPEVPTTGPAALMSVPERFREREIKSLDKGSFRLADFSRESHCH